MRGIPERLPPLTRMVRTTPDMPARGLRPHHSPLEGESRQTSRQAQAASVGGIAGRDIFPPAHRSTAGTLRGSRSAAPGSRFPAPVSARGRLRRGGKRPRWRTISRRWWSGQGNRLCVAGATTAVASGAVLVFSFWGYPFPGLDWRV